VQTNNWGTQNWRALLQRIAYLYPGHTLAMMGAGAEYDASSSVADGWRAVPSAGPVVNLCGQLQPRESAAFVAQAKLFLGHDSGPMHMAAAVQTPLVAVFSARNLPGVWFPQTHNSAVIYHSVNCKGCGLVKCVVQQLKCLTSISVDEVLDQVKRILPPALHIISSSANQGK